MRALEKRVCDRILEMIHIKFQEDHGELEEKNQERMESEI